MHLIALALALLTACTTTIRLSRDELQADIARRFPREVDKHLVTLRASDPRVEFPGRPGILGVRLRVEATSASGNSRIAGTARAEGRIEYVAAEHAFYLRDPRVTELVLEPAAGSGHLSGAVREASDVLGTRLVERAARALVEQVLRDHPVYRLDPARKKDAKAMRHLRSVRVDGEELVLEVAL